MLEKWGRGAAAAFLALSCWTTVLAAPARAAQTIAVDANPAVDVQLGTGQLTVQTWDQPGVRVVSAGNVSVRRLDAAEADPQIPRQIMVPAHTVSTAHGDVTLPREQFVLPTLEGSQHDAIFARGNGNTTVYVPRGTALVVAHVDRGGMTFNDYRGVFVAESHTGTIAFNRVAGSGFAESLQGRVEANDSTFDRMRVRTGTGDMLFRGCTSHQIQASSTYGSIVYDNGRFEPGLARFESVHGNVALGVRGSAQIGAQSGTGRVFSSFHNDARVRGGAGTTQATVRGGGPVVTAASKNGSVFLYNGSAATHPRFERRMQEYPGRAERPGRVPPPPQAPPSQGQGRRGGHRQPPA